MGAALAQIEAAIPGLIASLVVAGLTWLTRQIVDWIKRHDQSAARSAAGLALLHAGILQLVVNAESFVLGILISLVVGSANYLTAFVDAQLLAGTLTAIAVFAFFGVRTAPTVMWRHLATVALFTAPLTLLVNFVLALVLEPSKALSALQPAAIVFAFIQSFVAMGIGGVIAGWLRPKKLAYPNAYGAYGAPPIPPAHAQPPYPQRPAQPFAYPPNQPGSTPWQGGQPTAGQAPSPWPAPPMQPPQPGQPAYPPAQQPGQPAYPPAQQPPYPPPSGPQGPSGPGAYPPPGAPRQP
jgi:hypothetical protein